MDGSTPTSRCSRRLTAARERRRSLKKMKTNIIAIGVAILALNAHATQWPEKSLADLIADADIVVVGKINHDDFDTSGALSWKRLDSSKAGSMVDTLPSCGMRSISTESTLIKLGKSGYGYLKRPRAKTFTQPWVDLTRYS